MCTACKHLGLACEYKRPMWWGNNDMRRKHKEDIKHIIKRKKLSEKSSALLSDKTGNDIMSLLGELAEFGPPPLQYVLTIALQ